jgi:hypothetical protein
MTTGEDDEERPAVVPLQRMSNSSRKKSRPTSANPDRCPQGAEEAQPVSSLLPSPVKTATVGGQLADEDEDRRARSGGSAGTGALEMPCMRPALKMQEDRSQDRSARERRRGSGYRGRAPGRPAARRGGTGGGIGLPATEPGHKAGRGGWFQPPAQFCGTAPASVRRCQFGGA